MRINCNHPDYPGETWGDWVNPDAVIIALDFDGIQTRRLPCGCFALYGPSNDRLTEWESEFPMSGQYAVLISALRYVG